MIRVPVDEAYAFDMLSILRVKNEHVLTDAGVDAHDRLANAIRDEVGGELFTAIIASPEYTALVRINSALFDALEMLKRTDKHFEAATDGEWPPKHTIGEWPGAASEVDQMVYRRYLCKRALQQRFFPTVALTERKIGYSS
jgi:hypothetical protein